MSISAVRQFNARTARGAGARCGQAGCRRIVRPGRGRVAAVIACLGLLHAATATAQEPVLIPEWDAADDANAAAIDHGSWQAILDGYLHSDDPSGVHRFDYAALQANAADSARLADYLASLQQVDPRLYSRAEQKAYWINFYNALTIQVVLGEYPVNSIRSIHEGWIPRTGPWDDVHATVAGEELTLNHIEHGILRPIWRDNRIHYAVNCASYGCPNLNPTAFTADNTEALLEAGARDYVNHPRGVDFVDDDFLVVSSIYDWYTVDFGGAEEGVLDHLARYAEPELAARLAEFEGAIDYEYDWSLNEPGR